MPDLADHAYAHAVAVLAPGDAAVEVAVQAVRRGGRSRSAVLGHARHGAVRAAAEAPAPDLGVPAPPELPELAVALPATRPPLDRAIVDLDTRHGLDRRGLGRALGLPPATAASRAAAVYLEWHRQLDPVVLAHLGPGECDSLADTLAAALGDGASAAGPGGAPSAGPDASDTGDSQDRPPTLASLMAAGPAVVDHAAGCAACRDRLRAMVSVRRLLAQRPLEQAPPPVQAAAAPSRQIRFQARPNPPAAVEPGAGRTQLARAAAVVAAAVAVALGGGAVAANRNPLREARVESLTRLPAAGAALQVQPASVEGAPPPPVELRNTSARPATWVAEPDVAWLEVSPRGGRLEPGQSAPLRLDLRASPEGEVRAVVRISSSDGSATVVRVVAVVEHPPDVAADVRGCDVVATVEDEAEVPSVTLHWLMPAGGEASAPMDRAPDSFSAPLPPAPDGLTWWVSAADARGNQSRTSLVPLPAGSCP